MHVNHVKILCYADVPQLFHREEGIEIPLKDIHSQSDAPQHINHLSTVTLAMLIDFLHDCKILSCPQSTDKAFSAIVPISKRDPELFNNTAEDYTTLYVCHSDNVEAILEDHPNIFVLALTRDDELPQWIRHYTNQALLVHGHENFSYFSFLLQKYFMEILVWENDMDRVVLRKASLRELLNAASNLVNNFMSVNDSHFNLIAHSDRVEPPDSVSRFLIKEGCLPEKPINEWKEQILKRELMHELPKKEIPFDQLHHPIYINHSYFASLVMICNHTLLTEGLRDIFLKIHKRVSTLCEVLWKKHTQSSFPYYFFFARLMSGEEMSADYIRVQAALASIPDDAEFKLIALETGEISKPQVVEKAIDVLLALNKGNHCCFPYKDSFFALLFSRASDGMLSHHKTNEQLDTLIFKPFGINSGVSQVFTRLEDLPMAYKQTRIALRMKETIKSELSVAGELQNKGVFLFEETLLSYLISSHDYDERFLNFTFSHTIVKKLYAEDKKNNTNYLALFWFYLYYERNASLVAQRLHMHRNTVIYHIDKIQKRFDFDLSIQSAMERMRIDFKAFFLESSNETFEDVFAEAMLDQLPE